MSLVLLVAAAAVAAAAFLALHPNGRLAASAAVGFVRDGLLPAAPPPSYPSLASERVLVTGATSGLGRAVAADLLSCGARVTVAIRSRVAETPAELCEEALLVRPARGAPPRCDAVRADLGDLDSVAEAAAALAKAAAREGPLACVVVNAAVVPVASRGTPQGLEEAVCVNYVGHFMLVRRLLAAGALAEDARVVVVSSESHRVSCPLARAVAELGHRVPFGVSGAIGMYARTKLLLVAWAAELAARRPRLRVRAMCPGPVRTSIARHAPGWVRFLMRPVFALFFRAPSRAAQPVTALAAGGGGGGAPYQHVWTPKAAREDAAQSEGLYEATERVLAELGY